MINVTFTLTMKKRKLKHNYCFKDYTHTPPMYTENGKYLYLCIPGDNYVLKRIDLKSLFKKPKTIMNEPRPSGIVSIFVLGLIYVPIDTVMP